MTSDEGIGSPVENSSPLQTVDRALQVLLSYSEKRTEWGVLELAEEFNLNKSTSQRLLAALAARGFLKADPYTRRYSLGPAMWHMASLWERGGGLSTLAEQVLATLAARTGRTTLFTVPDGFHVRCIAAVDGEGGLVRSHPLVGEVFPAHAGATSRAYFAFLDSHVRRALLRGRPLARYTDLTSVDEAEFERLALEAFAQGWAYSEGEYDATTRAIAAPVVIGTTVVGSLSVLEPKLDAGSEGIMGCLPALLDACSELAEQLSNRSRAAGRRDWRKGMGRVQS